MRTLNFRDMKKFEDAFDFIDRVACLFCEGENITPLDILVNGDRLPSKLISFIIDKYKGNLKKLNHDFNDFSKKKNISIIIKYCFENNIQPFELWSEGLLSVSQNNSKEYVYECQFN